MCPEKTQIQNGIPYTTPIARLAIINIPMITFITGMYLCITLY
jgi:hypothetical protein